MISNLSQVVQVSLPKVSESAPAASSSSAGNVAAEISATSANPGGVQAAVNAGQNSGATNQALNDAIDKLNSKVQNLNRNLEFSLDKDSGDLLVKVVDAQTHKVIRQIPSEEALALAQNIDHYLQDHHIGLLQTKA